jgi:hypothetical protein
MTDEADRPAPAAPNSPGHPHGLRNADGTLIPGTQPEGHPQVVQGSAAAAMPETPFTPDPAIAGPQMPLMPGEGLKQAVDANQPVYANPQMSANWAARRPPTEKERLERAMNEGVEEDPREAALDNNNPDVNNPNFMAGEPVHEAPHEGEHAQETEEARRLREEQERLERERRDAERQESERHQQEQNQQQQG